MRRRLGRLQALNGDQWRALLAAVILVPIVRLSLRGLGFVRTVRALARLSRVDPIEPEPSRASGIVDAVGIVAGRSLIGTKCLGRSLVAWFLLRRRGIDAELVIGARSPSDGLLAAHAWVEVSGEPVNESPDVREQFGSLGLELPRLVQPGQP